MHATHVTVATVPTPCICLPFLLPFFLVSLPPPPPLARFLIPIHPGFPPSLSFPTPVLAFPPPPSSCPHFQAAFKLFFVCFPPPPPPRPLLLLATLPFSCCFLFLFFLPLSFCFLSASTLLQHRLGVVVLLLLLFFPAVFFLSVQATASLPSYLARWAGVLHLHLRLFQRALAF